MSTEKTAHYLRHPESEHERSVISCFNVVEKWEDDWDRCPLCFASPDNDNVIVHCGPLESKYLGLLI